MAKIHLVLALFVLAGPAVIGTAQAQCQWTGLGSSCSAPPLPYHPPAYGGASFGYYNGTPGLIPYAGYGAALPPRPNAGGGYLGPGASNPAGAR